MSMEKMREEFEAAIAIEVGMREQDFRDDRDGDSYVSVGPKYAWWGYQASRAALVIELPKPYAVIGDYAACGGGRLVWDVEYAEKITDRMCEKTAVYDRATIESAGLRVKP